MVFWIFEFKRTRACRWKKRKEVPLTTRLTTPPAFNFTENYDHLAAMHFLKSFTLVGHVAKRTVKWNLRHVTQFRLSFSVRLTARFPRMPTSHTTSFASRKRARASDGFCDACEGKFMWTICSAAPLWVEDCQNCTNKAQWHALLQWRQACEHENGADLIVQKAYSDW